MSLSLSSTDDEMLNKTPQYNRIQDKTDSKFLNSLSPIHTFNIPLSPGLEIKFNRVDQRISLKKEAKANTLNELNKNKNNDKNFKVNNEIKKKLHHRSKTISYKFNSNKNNHHHRNSSSSILKSPPLSKNIYIYHKKHERNFSSAIPRPKLRNNLLNN